MQVKSKNFKRLGRLEIGVLLTRLSVLLFSTDLIIARCVDLIIKRPSISTNLT